MIDPDTRPASSREAWLLALVRHRGYTLRRAQPGSAALVLTGYGGCIRVASLAALSTEDLDPNNEPKKGSRYCRS